jgi:hypothetical protein
MCSRIKLRDRPAQLLQNVDPLSRNPNPHPIMLTRMSNEWKDKLSEKHKTDPVFRKILLQSLSLCLKHQKRVEKKTG